MLGFQGGQDKCSARTCPKLITERRQRHVFNVLGFLMINNWSLLVKPTHSCNLNCKYCYEKPNRDKYKNITMSYETVDKIARLASEHAKDITWIWHGGEPTLVGVEWYRRVQDIFYKYYNSNFRQDMQSNGLLLDKEWAKLSRETRINIGVSYDGPDMTERVGSQAQRIENGLKCFIEEGIPIGIITVINSSNVHRMIYLYDYFKERFNYNKNFNVAFNRIYRSNGSLENNIEASNDIYNEYFKEFYNYWLHDDSSNAMDERTAMQMSAIVMGDQRGLTCAYSDCRYKWIGVNANGDVYPCDRYVPDIYYMGNIKDAASITDLYNTTGYRQYVNDIDKRFATVCKECGYLSYCRGDCNANHIAVSGTAAGNDAEGCKGFISSFKTVYSVLRDVDFYNDRLNPHFVALALDCVFFPTAEIKDFLKTKGCNTDWTFDISQDNLLQSKEYKIFKLFNGLETSRINSIDIYHKFINQRNTDRKALINIRHLVLEEIFRQKESEIRKELNA